MDTEEAAEVDKSLRASGLVELQLWCLTVIEGFNLKR